MDNLTEEQKKHLIVALLLIIIAMQLNILQQQRMMMTVMASHLCKLKTLSDVFLSLIFPHKQIESLNMS